MATVINLSSLDGNNGFRLIRGRHLTNWAARSAMPGMSTETAWMT